MHTEINFGSRLILSRCLLLALVGAVLIGCGDDPASPEQGFEPNPGARVQITQNGGRNPTAARDGGWLAYEGANLDIYKIRTDGSQEERLASGVQPDWSRSGNLIVAKVAMDGGMGTIDAVTKEVALIAQGTFDDDPAWSPLGNEIAVEGDGIVIVSYPAGQVSAVPCNDPDGSQCAGETPTWSPDGDWIAFEDGLEILKVRRSGGDAEVVVEGLADVAEPAWSPNGKWIAFSMEDTTFTGGLERCWHIWIADSRGMDQGLWRVTDGAWTTGNPTWSPDSRVIYFNSVESGNQEIWQVRIDEAM